MSVANAGVHNHANTATWHSHSHIAAHASMMAAWLLLQHICDSWQGIVAPHQQIPYFGTVLTVIIIIVQYLTVLTAYVATGSQFHRNTALAQYVYSTCYIRYFTKFHQVPSLTPAPLHHHCNHTITAQSHLQVHFFFVLFCILTNRSSVCTPTPAYPYACTCMHLCPYSMISPTVRTFFFVY